MNILLLGIDQREKERGPWRTDTMIVLSLDPATSTISMLSIPRDLWVTIPGYGESRINMAHFLGDQNRYPGGGPALAKKTVQYAIGVPVHYYVRINFTGFEEFIDAIGGVTVNVEKPIHDEKYPDNSYGYMTIDIPAGVQQMDGQTALQYARTRHGSSDFERMSRQQVVILAVRDKVLGLNIPISRIPQMINALGDTVQTDLTIDEIITLARLAQKVDRSQIRHGVIDASMTTSVTTPQGWMVEVPRWEKVQGLVSELFPAPLPSAAPTPSLPLEQVPTEQARIELENGTAVADLAQKTTESLKARGLYVLRYDNADRFDYRETMIIDYGNNKPYTVAALAVALNVKPGNIRYERNSRADVDIRVILGQDQLQP